MVMLLAKVFGRSLHFLSIEFLIMLLMHSKKPEVWGWEDQQNCVKLAKQHRFVKASGQKNDFLHHYEVQDEFPKDG